VLLPDNGCRRLGINTKAISPHLPDAEQLPAAAHSFAARNLSALAITETELKLMAAAAIALTRFSAYSNNQRLE